jgi:hypothetical protein
VSELVAQVIDVFKVDGTNCDMLSHDLHGLTESQKFKAAREWGTANAGGLAQAQAKINERKAELDSSAGPAIHACGGGVQSILMQMVR